MMVGSDFQACLLEMLGLKEKDNNTSSINTRSVARGVDIFGPSDAVRAHRADI